MACPKYGQNGCMLKEAMVTYPCHNCTIPGGNHMEWENPITWPPGSGKNINEWLREERARVAKEEAERDRAQ